ncbi:MAG: DNA translocase FtsK [Alphaproteobacteria bacterium]|jgi:DNA segregation ATPase FtsK/SpoIIIE, S-DNA-T family|nr:DNA translocase FtsK [Alphaproteobacteria bacterium]MBT5827426.1 DNA translocase FtsK [Alphaproteobacteria bacterium]
MPKKQKTTRNFWYYRSIELLGLLFLLTTTFLAFSLFSYHPLDPSFNTSFDNIIYNKAGLFGSYTASFFLEFFGVSAYLLPVFFLCWAFLFMKKKVPEFITLRLIALFCSIISSCYFLSNINSSHSWEFVSYGGILGFYLKYLLLDIGAKTLLIFISLLLFLVCFCFAHNISVSASFSYINRAIFYLAKLICKNIMELPHFIKHLFLMFYNFAEKRIHKKRVSNVDSSYLKAKEKIAKIDKTSTPRQKKSTNYMIPSLDLLKDPKKYKNNISKEHLQNRAKQLREILADFGVNGKMLDVKPGPVVTLYEFEPAAGVKSSRIIGLADDVARSMSATSARISVLSGQNAIGIELPNEERETVYFKSIISSESFIKGEHNVPLALGKNIGGAEILADLAKMPHLLVAGTTGSGKSVAINTMILSILYKLPPSECKFLMVDPKMLELSVYDGIPHLISPVVTEPRKAVQVLKWAVQEMENRYRLMSSLGVRSISGYNKAIKQAIKDKKTLTRTVQTGFDAESGKPIFEEVELDMQTLPFIVVIVDEMADLMLVAGKEIEAYIQRLAQMARAAGIHLIVATQRPSVDVITGVIKANFPTRISFQVTSKVDSRTILGEQGAEQLLGMGDMLYTLGGSKLTRVHGAFIDDKEVRDVVSYLKKQAKPEYVESIFEVSEDEGNYGGDYSGDSNNNKDELYDKAVNIILTEKKVSTSFVQRQLRIGYNRAANIVEQMEEEGVISAANATGKREILVNN